MSEPKAPSPVLYTAHATAIGGREGHVKTDDGLLDVDVAMPHGLGGKGGATNPEQLFAAGYAACFGSAVAHVARTKKITTGSVEIRTHVSIGPVGAGFGLSVELEAHLPEMQRADAEALVEAAHAVCPYSNATRGNVPVVVKVA